MVPPLPIQPINCLFLTSSTRIELTFAVLFVVVTVGILSEDEARDLFDMCVAFVYSFGGSNHLFISAAFTMDVRHSSPFSMPRWIRTKHCAADRHFALMRYVWSLQKSKMEVVSCQTFFSPSNFCTLIRTFHIPPHDNWLQTRPRDRYLQTYLGGSAEDRDGYDVFARDETGGRPGDHHHCRLVH